MEASWKKISKQWDLINVHRARARLGETALHPCAQPDNSQNIILLSQSFYQPLVCVYEVAIAYRWRLVRCGVLEVAALSSSNASLRSANMF